MQKIVGEWIDQQLPFVKNQMVQLYQIAKHYQLPSETLTNLVANDIPLSDREASLVAQFKEKGTALLSHVMDEAMDHLTPDKGFELIKQLGDKLSFQDLKLTLENFLKGEGYHGVKDSEIAQNLEVNSQGKENVEHSKIEVLLNNLSQVKMGQEDSQDKMALLLKQMMGMMPKDKIKLFAEALVNKYLAIDNAVSLLSAVFTWSVRISDSAGSTGHFKQFDSSSDAPAIGSPPSGKYQPGGNSLSSAGFNTL